MENKNLITTIIGVLVFAVVVMFGAAYFMSNGDEPSDEAGGEEQVAGEDEHDERYSFIESVTAKQFYEDGTHTFAGELTMPTPCDLLEVEAEVAEAAPEQVHLSFTVVNTAEACAQVMTEQRFMVSVDAGEDASVTADLMGREIDVNLVPPEPGETPDDFELFIKG